ncbi:cation-translocating P-type ATPase [Oscillochloris sp. ZM17-4]|uniref:cation-translocating P-type ATPase n=1 Tax=Oscillochloris sp. ZM17-4 TaxID=2866714 RepID=UPI001C738D08|nr:cation-translocating P-type ATPase [Oscillochloris sp. ZM17-4]MBX0330849.1 cation-translocating P-type ATPase [Oscillochloris sp. ZM17-4]
MTSAAKPPYAREVSDLLAELDVSPARGLSAEDAAGRLGRHGRNELPSPPPTPAWLRFLAQFRDPLTGLLLAATVISFVAWLIERAEPVPFETITILAIVLLNGALGFVQESRAEQAVAALQAMSSPTARVLRDGAQQQVPSAEVVPGDILLIEEGDTLPADARVIESIAMRVAESTLTGESSAVSKDSAAIPGEASIGDRQNMVFGGTAVASGRGRALVTATGPSSEIGKIAGSLQEAEDESTPLQRELARVGKLLGIVVIIIAVVMSVTIVLVDEVRDLGELVDVLLLGVSLAVAAVPEGLTAITTIVLSLGMQRMAKRNVIVRKLSAVETLGSTTVICSDKTGTLTKNEMTVRAVITAGGRVDLTGIGYAPEGELERAGAPLADPALRTEVQKTLRAADLANNAGLLRGEDGRWTIQGDPTEGAILVAARKAGLTDDELGERFPRVAEVPFSSERKLMSTAHTDAEHRERVIVFAKGAPDILLSRCEHERVGEEVRTLSDERRAAIISGVESLAGEALRTLGVAYRTLPIADFRLQIADLKDDAEAARTSQSTIYNLQSAISEKDVERELVFLGVIGMIDPPRPEAQAAVADARVAGVRPIMITGDHPTTAAAIAAELGIAAAGERAVRGAEIEQMDEAALRAAVVEHSVYARVAPEHKLRIVRALKANGEIAAMTGDGVNDAPALKSADIGVAMGITGTDVSKGAADMILTDDNFASIVAAVEEGRSIFANIQKFLRYLLSSNIGEVFTMFFGVVLADLIGLVPEAGSAVVLPLLATQILWVNLLTDSAPALALGVDPADHDVMTRPPRDPRSNVITGPMWFDIVLIGSVMGAGTLGVMDWALPGGLLPGGAGDIHYAQTLAFTTLVIFQLFNVFNARFERHSAFHKLGSNGWLWLAVALSVALQVAVVYVPVLQQAFSTVPLTPMDWLICTAVGSTVLWAMELRKGIGRLRAA